MSNVTTYGGLRLKKIKLDQTLETVYIPSGNGNRLGIGDPVSILSATYGSVGSGPNVCQVARTVEGAAMYGVIQSFLPQYNDGTASMDLTINYLKTSTAGYALIRPANNQDVYEIADDGSTGGNTFSSNVAQNCNLAIADCDTASGLSKVMLDLDTCNTTATLNVKIIGPSTDVRNDPTSTGARWLVTINNVQRSGGTGTATI